MQLLPYVSRKLWLQGIVKHGLNHATSTVITALTTNGLEGMFPKYFSHVGLTLAQCAAMFFVTLFITVLLFVNHATQSGGTNPPIPPAQ